MEFRLTGREMENFIFGRFNRIFGDILEDFWRNFGEIGLFIMLEKIYNEIVRIMRASLRECVTGHVLFSASLHACRNTYRVRGHLADRTYLLFTYF